MLQCPLHNSITYKSQSLFKIIVLGNKSQVILSIRFLLKPMTCYTEATTLRHYEESTSWTTSWCIVRPINSLTSQTLI